MKEAKAITDKIVGGVLVALMGVAVLNVLWQVFTRFALEAPSSFTEELARYLLIWIGVLGAGYAVGQRAHLALELLPDQFTGRLRRWLEIVILGCTGFFAFFVLAGGGAGLVYVQFRLGQTSPSLGWPLGGVYMVLPLSGLLMTFYVVERAMSETMQELDESEGAVPSTHSTSATAGDGHGPGQTEPAREEMKPPSAQARKRSANQTNQPPTDL